MMPAANEEPARDELPEGLERRVMILERSHSAILNATDALFLQTSELARQQQILSRQLADMPEAMKSANVEAIRAVFMDDEIRTAMGATVADAVAEGIQRKAKRAFLDTVWGMTTDAGAIIKRGFVVALIAFAAFGPLGLWPLTAKFMESAAMLLGFKKVDQ